VYDGVVKLLFDREDGIRWFEQAIQRAARGELTLVGHHHWYDLGVLVAERPDLLPFVFQALDAGMIKCTKIRQMMIDNAQGELKFIEDEFGDLKANEFTLQKLTYRLLQRYIPKGADTWRLRYNELDGVPIVDWPEKAKQYAIDDAVNTYDVYTVQDDLVAPEGIPGELGRHQTAWALYLMSLWGIRTDRRAVEQLRDSLVVEVEKLLVRLIPTGLVRPDRTRDMKAIRARVEARFLDLGRPVPLTEGKQTCTEKDVLLRTGDPDLKHLAEYAHLGKLLTTYVPLLLRGAEVPINASYNAILETYRTSCSKPNCFDGETEVLTRAGWVAFRNLSGATEIAQWDNGVISFVMPELITSQSSELVTVENEHINLYMTPDHRCLLRHRKTGVLRVVSASDYKEDWQQLHGGMYFGGDLEMSEDELLVACATQADGSWHDGGIKFGFRKGRKIARLVAGLERLQVPFSVRAPTVAKPLETRIHIFKGSLTSKIFDLLGAEKKLGPWVLQLSREHLSFFCEEVFRWDGCITTMNQYASALRSNAEWVQIALVLSSKRANVRVYKPTPDSVEGDHRVLGQRRLSFQVDVTHRDFSLTTNAKIQRVPHNAEVYCATVPSSFLLVRRNGKTAITGNCQNPPRKGGVRECFVPREHAHADVARRWVFITCDYDTLEMRTLAQCLLDFFGRSAMAEALRAGRDLHLALGAELLGISYDEARTRYDAGDKIVDEARQFAKIANFGFPGGLAADTLRDYARKSYGKEISAELAIRLHQTFRTVNPEMVLYFALASKLAAGDVAPHIVFPRSGLVRGMVPYTAICNGWFQNLAAMGATDALYCVSKECYLGVVIGGKLDGAPSPLAGCRPVIFLHDEILLEAPEERASVAADRLQEIMVARMTTWVPDIPIKASPSCFRRWYKGAKAVRVGGQLVPSRPVDAGGKVTWVEDRVEVVAV